MCTCTLSLGALSTTAHAQAVRPALLIQQVWTDSNTGLDVVEIHNPADQTVDLSTIYIASSPSYWGIVNNTFSPEDDSAFLVQFPEGATLAAQDSAYVVLRGTSQDFETSHGRAPDFAVGSEDASRALRVPTLGRAPVQALEPSGGLLVLFYWDGVEDRVKDADILFWGDSGLRVDKTGVEVDGPDDNDVFKTFRADTPIAEQRPAPAFEDGRALVRTGEEGAETSPGNGIDATDETSEDLGAHWEVSDPVVSEPVETVQLQGTIQTGARLDEVSAGTLVFFAEGEEDISVAFDTDATFTASLPPDTTWGIRVESDALLDTPNPNTVTLGTDGTQDLELTVDGVWVVSGSVQVAEGDDPALLDGVSVALLNDEGAEVGQQELSQEGLFAFSLRENGFYTLSVRSPQLTQPVTRDVQLDAESATGLEITLASEAPAETYTLSGTVRDSHTNAPLEGVQVELSGPAPTTVVTDASGAYVFPELSAGSYTVAASLDTFEAFQTDVAVQSDTTLDIALVSTLTYSLGVSVQDPSGAAISGATLTLSASRTFVEGTTADTGVASFAELHPGNYVLTVSAQGFRPLTIETIAVQRDTDLTVALVPETRVPDVTTSSDCSQGGSLRQNPASLWSVLIALLFGFVWRRRRAQ